jgi:hypothetical protein
MRNTRSSLASPKGRGLLVLDNGQDDPQAMNQVSILPQIGCVPMADFRKSQRLSS